MKPYLLFLRAVNVSGKNLVKMALLQEKLQQAGYMAVKTYIQSGNIYLKSDTDPNSLQKEVQDLLKEQFQLDIACFILSPEELSSILQDNPFSYPEEGNRVFITLLDQIPESQTADLLQELVQAPEAYALKDNILYFYLPNGMANSKLNNNFFEKKLKVTATGRNLNSMQKMLEIAQQSQ